MHKHGFVRISTISPRVVVGNPMKNAKIIVEALKRVPDSEIVVFPELCITGYTCGDLFENDYLLKKAEDGVQYIASHISEQWGKRQLIFIGAPIPLGNQLLNGAVAINENKVAGIVTKQNLPSSHEFYEGRNFSKGTTQQKPTKSYAGIIDVPIGPKILFKNGQIVVGVDICEDIFMPNPPSSYHCLAGANIIVNLSASNELVGKADYRRQLVAVQSGRCVAAYAYCSAGPTESTSEVVFGGHCMIAENGTILEESGRIGDVDNPVDLSEKLISVDVDVKKLQMERRTQSSFRDASEGATEGYRFIHFMSFDQDQSDERPLKRFVNPYPFVPNNPETLQKRCAEVFGIQCAGLARRLIQLDGGFNNEGLLDAQHKFRKTPKVVIGISGGLDSTLALLVAVKTYKSIGLDMKGIVGITMPGFGTTKETKNSALMLMNHTEITSEIIDIRPICLHVFKEMKHKAFGVIDCTADWTPESFEEALMNLTEEVLAKGDLVFENVQARQRTLFLMSRGFVIGTGDMSEIAEGWMTYNGDHMSMYAVNCGVPKTLVRFIVEYFAKSQCDPLGLEEELIVIVNRMISAELLPKGKDGKIVQSTEAIIGPYDLIDFTMHGLIREKFSPSKILYLMKYAKFKKEFDEQVMLLTINTFVRRVFSQHFKDHCVPDGVMVGSLSLSPRGYLRWPSEIDPEIFLEDLK